MKKHDAKSLRDALTLFFENLTEKSRNENFPKDPDMPMDEATKALFQRTWDATIALIKGNVKEDDGVEFPNGEYYRNLERLFSYQLCFFYDSYKLREDVTDEEILAHRAAIRAKDVKALDGLRTAKDRRLYEMVLSESYVHLHALNQNVRYLLNLLASHAKHLGSVEGAFAFLRAASQLQRCDRPHCIYFTPGQIDTIISEFRAGVDAMRLQSDYNSLKEWPIFRAEQAKVVAAEDVKTKGGKK